MEATLRLGELEQGAAGDDIATEVDEVYEDVLERQHARLARDDGQVVDAEGGLERRLLEELVEDDLCVGVAPKLDDHAHTGAVRLVAQVGDALDNLLTDELGEALKEPRLVHLEGELGDDDGVFAGALVGLDVGLCADADGALAGLVGLPDAVGAVDVAGGREVGAGDKLHEAVEADLGVVDDRDGGAEHLSEIVGRDAGGHADRDALRAVDDEVGEAGRKDRRLLLGAVVVVAEVDGVLLDVVHELAADASHTDFGVTHGGRRIAVDGAEVALTIDQRHPHREVLGHTDEGVIDRLVAVRVILTDDVADDTGRLLVGAVPGVGLLVHREEDATVNGFEAVTDIGERAADDDRHRVVQVGGAHLVFDANREQCADVGVRRLWATALVLAGHVGSV